MSSTVRALKRKAQDDDEDDQSAVQSSSEEDEKPEPVRSQRKRARPKSKKSSKKRPKKTPKKAPTKTSRKRKTTSKAAADSSESEDSSESQADEDGLGGHALSKRIVDGYKDMGKNLSSWVEGSSEHKRKQFAKILPQNPPKGYVHPFVPQSPTFDSRWTQKDEDQLLEDWARLRQNHRITESKTAYRSLWLVCFLIAKCTPWDIAGLAGNFVYKHGPQGRPSEFRGSMWSEGFCSQLATLVPHPAWSSFSKHGRAHLLRAALQYTVMLRTNDQRPWFPECAGDVFLEVLWGVSQAQKDKKEPIPVHTLRRKVAAECKRRGVGGTTMSSVFRSLETLIKIPEKPLLATEDDILSITLGDLKTLTQALNKVKDPNTGMVMWMEAEVISACTVEPHIKKDSITFEQLIHWDDLAQLQELRLLRLPPLEDDADLSMSSEAEEDLA